MGDYAVGMSSGGPSYPQQEHAASSSSFYPNPSKGNPGLSINTGNSQYLFDNSNSNPSSNNSPARSSFPQSSSTASYPYSTTDHGFQQAPQPNHGYQQPQDQYGNNNVQQPMNMYNNYGNVKSEHPAGGNGYGEAYGDMNQFGNSNNQMQYSDSSRNHQPSRIMTDNFGTVGAGPPSPGKMDMLPHGHKSAHHPYTAQQKNKARATDEYHPVAPTSGRANTTKGSSTTSEFTKRKNWSQRIVEEMQDVLHVLSPSGVFLFASPSVFEITGYSPEELVGRGITDFIERDDIDTFIKDFTGSIHNDTALTTYFRFRRKDDRSVLFEVTGQAYYTDSTSPGLNPNEPSTSQLKIKTKGGDGSKTCKCLFAMARLYPSKNNAMLDSFLELKVENEKLRQKLAEIYKEIEGDPEESQMGSSTDFSYNRGTATGERQISGFPSRMSGVFAAQNAAAAQVMDPQFASQQQQQQQQQQGGYNMDESYNTYYPQQSGQQQQQQQYQPQQQGSIAPQQTGGDPNNGRGSAINQDNVLVSSSGLIPSNSNTYGALGIGISNSARGGHQQQQQAAQAFNNMNNNNNPNNPGNAVDGAEAEGDKKKKMKKARTDEGEFVCRDCGTVDSPEWRRGPLGPKTLCNACGLRWAKKNKQQNRQSLGNIDTSGVA